MSINVTRPGVSQYTTTVNDERASHLSAGKEARGKQAWGKPAWGKTGGSYMWQASEKSQKLLHFRIIKWIW